MYIYIYLYTYIYIYTYLYTRIYIYTHYIYMLGILSMNEDAIVSLGIFSNKMIFGTFAQKIMLTWKVVINQWN